MRKVYLDNNATTTLAPEVLAAMLPYFSKQYGNPSRPHLFGREARKAVEDAREAVARALHASPAEVLFTASGTESDNLAIVGAARALADKGRHLITSKIEHSAVLETCRQLEKNGFAVTDLPVSPDGVVSPDSLETALREAKKEGQRTTVVSVMHANNDTGAIQPLAALSRIAHEHGALFHSDAAQSAGRVPCDVQALGCDLLSISAHKFHGPKGVGGLYVRKGTRLEPLLFGGDQENGLRPGTENVPGIVGLSYALSLASERMPSMMERVRSLLDRLERGLCEAIGGVTVNGPMADRLPNTVNLSFAGVEGEALLVNLDLAGIAVGAGSACTSGALEPSHVLVAMGLSRQAAQSSIRFSLSAYTTADEIEHVIHVLPPLVAKLRQPTSACRSAGAP